MERDTLDPATLPALLLPVLSNFMGTMLRGEVLSKQTALFPLMQALYVGRWERCLLGTGSMKESHREQIAACTIVGKRSAVSERGS